MKPSPAQREETRLKRMLSVRERQFRIAVTALKRIIAFETAYHSVFASEVYLLQRHAMDALVGMENAQRKKPLKSSEWERAQLPLDKIRMRMRFNSQTRRDEDE